MPKLQMYNPSTTAQILRGFFLCPTCWSPLVYDQDLKMYVCPKCTDSVVDVILCCRPFGTCSECGAPMLQDEKGNLYCPVCDDISCYGSFAFPICPNCKQPATGSHCHACGATISDRAEDHKAPQAPLVPDNDNQQEAPLKRKRSN